MPTRLPLLLLLLSMTQLLHADEGVVPLQHRPADELAPLLTPFLEEGERLVANGDQVILSAGPDRLLRLASIVRSLDRPLRRLRLTLRRDPPPPPGVRRHRVGGEPERQLTVAEGERMEIFDGSRELIVTKAFDGLHGRGIEQQERERGSWLRVRVQLVGDDAVVELEVAEERSGLEGGKVDRTTSRLPVKLGEWLQLSGRAARPRGHTTARGDSLWLRVSAP